MQLQGTNTVKKNKEGEQEKLKWKEENPEPNSCEHQISPMEEIIKPSSLLSLAFSGRKTRSQVIRIWKIR